MNERIRALLEQSTKQTNPDDREWVFSKVDQEKFAELIVSECIKVVDDMADPEDSERYFWAIQNASQKIKQHFGVEE